MGGPNGIGFGGNEPRIINLPSAGNVGNVGGVRPDSVQPGGAQRNIPSQTGIRPQEEPPRAADVVGSLDVLLLKALNSASGDFKAVDVTKAAAKAKLPQETRSKLRSLAETAQTCLAELDKFTGKDLAAAMAKNADNSVDWKEGSMVAEAFKAAQNAQEALSMELANALGKASNGKTQAVLEELMLQCDRRVAEIETLVLQMTEIIDTGGKNAEENAAALAGSGTISSYTSANALDKFGRTEMLNALKSDLKPLTDRLDAYEKDGGKNLTKADINACVRDLNTLKARFSGASAAGLIEVGGRKVAMDRSLLAEASKLLDGAGKKIKSLHREVLQRTMMNFVEKDIPFIDEEVLSPKYANELRRLTNPSVTDRDLNNLAEYLKALNTYRSAARAYANSPTRENALDLSRASHALADMPRDSAKKCLSYEAIIAYKPASNASAGFKAALKNFQMKAIEAGENNQPIQKMVRSVYGNIHIATKKLLGFGKELEVGAKDKYFISSAVLDVFKGDTSIAPLVESRVHGYSDSDINTDLDDKNVTESKTLGNGNFNTVTLVKVKNGSEWVFKPELAGRLTAPNSSLNDGLSDKQEMTRINLAVQSTADVLGLGDVMVKTTVGTHKGQFGMFMEKAPGIDGKEFKKSDQSGIKAMNDADFGKVVGNMMRKFNRMQWFDVITGQGDRHAGNYMVNVGMGANGPEVDIKAIDNDASYGVFRLGLNKFVLQPGSRLYENFLSRGIDQLANRLDEGENVNEPRGSAPANPADASTAMKKKLDFKRTILNDPCLNTRPDGTIEVDLSKPGNVLFLRACLQHAGLRGIIPPAEIDSELHDRLVSLAKDAPDGGQARKEYLNSLAARLGRNSVQYHAAVLRLDDAIAHARKLKNEGRVYSAQQWENHDIQRKIAAPNMANMNDKIDTYGRNVHKNAIDHFSAHGRLASFTNTFFRDFYDALIKGSNRENWFSPQG